MNFLKEFIKNILEIIGSKILSKPLSFLGVTGTFIIVLYLIWLENGELGFSAQENITLGITYIIVLNVFMNKENPSSKERDKDNKSSDKVVIKQNNISLFSFFRNTKK